MRDYTEGTQQILSRPRVGDPDTSDWTLSAPTHAECQRMIDRVMNQDGIIHACFDIPTRYWPPGEPKRYVARGTVRVVPIQPDSAATAS